MDFSPVEEPVEEKPKGRTGRMVALAVVAVLGVIVLGGALILLLGGGQTAAPPAAPSETPPAEACTLYQTTGIVLAGTSGDYPPFEYYLSLIHI